MPADSARATRAVFDIQIDEPHGRRRRPAPDWGGDDLFDHVPRRRFSRTGDAPAHLRLVTDAAEAPPAVRVAPEPSPVSDLVLARRSEYELGPSSAPPGGRRTVTITGRPGPAYAPRRSVEQRITHRPDHVAALACALGVLLVVIALLS